MSFDVQRRGYLFNHWWSLLHDVRVTVTRGWRNSNVIMSRDDIMTLLALTLVTLLCAEVAGRRILLCKTYVYILLHLMCTFLVAMSEPDYLSAHWHTIIVHRSHYRTSQPRWRPPYFYFLSRTGPLTLLTLEFETTVEFRASCSTKSNVKYDNLALCFNCAEGWLKV